MLIGFSAFTLIATPAVTLGVVLGGNKAASSNLTAAGANQPQGGEGGGLDGGDLSIPSGGEINTAPTPFLSAAKEVPLTAAELLTMASNGRELRDSIRDQYPVLVPEAQDSQPYNTFVTWVKNLPESKVRDHALITHKLQAWKWVMI